MRSCFSEDTKRVILNQYKISDKAPYIIYADLECLIENLQKYWMDVKIILKIDPQQCMQR